MFNKKALLILPIALLGLVSCGSRSDGISIEKAKAILAKGMRDGTLEGDIYTFSSVLTLKEGSSPASSYSLDVKYSNVDDIYTCTIQRDLFGVKTSYIATKNGTAYTVTIKEGDGEYRPAEEAEYQWATYTFLDLPNYIVYQNGRLFDDATSYVSSLETTITNPEHSDNYTSSLQSYNFYLDKSGTLTSIFRGKELLFLEEGGFFDEWKEYIPNISKVEFTCKQNLIQKVDASWESENPSGTKIKGTFRSSFGYNG